MSMRQRSYLEFNVLPCPKAIVFLNVDELFKTLPVAIEI
jgi:hypothetical protein